jgi:hypothetical protein
VIVRSIISLVVLFLLQACQTTEIAFPNDKVAQHYFARCVSNKDMFPSEKDGAVHCRCLAPVMMESLKPEVLNVFKAMLEGGSWPDLEFWRAMGDPFKEDYELGLSEACPNLDKYWKDLKSKRLLEPSPAMRQASDADVCEGVKYGNPGFIAEAKSRGLSEKDCSQ